jgi:hypothetical protein
MRIQVIDSLLLAAGMVFLSTPSSAQVRLSVTIAPPALLVYEQPICPGDGYIWTPGYWAWDDAYYWVPGTWVMAPQAGYLWPPGYWGWGGDAFLFNEGYWGTSVGFYGGINYGFGYFGLGYEGGRWDNGHFFYNTTLNNVNVNVIHNVYNTRVNEASVSRVSYNGGNGGINARATAQEETAARGSHIAPVAAQTEHAQAARSDPQRSAANRSAPAAAASRPNTAVHPTDLPAVEHPARPNTGNVKQDQQYQKQQDQLVAKQNQERQNLQQQQTKEHQQLAKQGANEAKTQQLEQQHQNQTQQMQQGHAQQMQQMQQRQQPAGGRGGGRK